LRGKVEYTRPEEIAAEAINRKPWQLFPLFGCRSVPRLTPFISTSFVGRTNNKQNKRKTKTQRLANRLEYFALASICFIYFVVFPLCGTCQISRGVHFTGPSNSGNFSFASYYLQYWKVAEELDTHIKKGSSHQITKERLWKTLEHQNLSLINLYRWYFSFTYSVQTGRSIMCRF